MVGWLESGPPNYWLGRLGADFSPPLRGERAWKSSDAPRLMWNASSRRPAVDRGGSDPSLYAVPACAQGAVHVELVRSKRPTLPSTSVDRGKLRLAWWLVGDHLNPWLPFPSRSWALYPSVVQGRIHALWRLISNSRWVGWLGGWVVRVRAAQLLVGPPRRRLLSTSSR